MAIVSFNRRGQTFIDILLIAIIIMVSATSFVMVSMIQKEISRELIADKDFNATHEAVAALQTFDDNFTTSLDNTMLIVFILFWVFIIVSSLFVDANPIYLIISVVLLVIVLISMGVMSNAYEEFINDGDVYTYANGFPKTNYIIEHLVLFCVFIAFSGIIAIYGKNALGGGVY